VPSRFPDRAHAASYPMRQVNHGHWNRCSILRAFPSLNRPASVALSADSSHHTIKGSELFVFFSPSHGRLAASRGIIGTRRTVLAFFLLFLPGSGNGAPIPAVVIHGRTRQIRRFSGS